MSTTGGPVDEARPSVLNPVTLLGEAIGMIFSWLPQALCVWFASSLGLAAAAFADGSRELQVKSLDMSALSLASVATALFCAGASALFMRLLLEGRDGWLNLDWRLLECAGLLALGQLLPSAAFDLVAGGRGVPIESAAQVYLLLGRSAAALAAWYVSAKLILWPLGRLVGRADLTPGRSWFLMRRTVRSLFLVWLLTGFPTLLAWDAMKLLRFDLQSLPTAYLIADACLNGATGLVTGAVVVAIYRRRVGDEPSLAEIFD